MSLNTHTVACEICYAPEPVNEPVRLSVSHVTNATVEFSPTGEVLIHFGKLTLRERSDRNGPSWECSAAGWSQHTHATAQHALEAILATGARP